MKRNLLYNCCALLSNEEWRLNVERLNRHAHIFNGRKIVLVKEGPGTVDFDTVKAAFRFEAEFRRVPNDPVLGEVTGFVAALRELHSLDPNEATFYAHTKGVSRANDPKKLESIRLWRNTMYRECLGNPERIEATLAQYACCGCFKFEKPFPLDLDPSNSSTWHFSGTFFWFRHDKLFSTTWDEVQPIRHGIEVYLGSKFTSEESYCLFENDIKRNLYMFWVPSTPMSEHVLEVSDSAKLIFLHNHKTGGQSIAKALRQVLPDVRAERVFMYPTPPGLCLRQELKWAGYEDYRVFGFVRNPWDRLVSWHAMLAQEAKVRQRHAEKHAEFRNCKRCVRKIQRRGLLASTSNWSCWKCGGWRKIWDPHDRLCEYRIRFLKTEDRSLSSFVKNVVHQHEIGRSQLSTYFEDSAGELVTTEPIGRFENLQGDFSSILKSLGLPDVQLPLVNVTKHAHYTHLYDDKTRELVGEIFAKDIERFNYAFGQ